MIYKKFIKNILVLFLIVISFKSFPLDLGNIVEQANKAAAEQVQSVIGKGGSTGGVGLPAQPPALNSPFAAEKQTNTDLTGKLLANKESGPSEPKGFLGKFRQGFAEGRVYPSIYYNYPFQLTGALAYYIPSELDFKSFFVQTEFGLKSVTIRGGIAEISSIGAGYSIAPVITQVLTNLDDNNTFEKGTLIGAELSFMFALSVIRFSFYKPINAKEETNIKTVLSVGFGVF